MLHVMNSSAAIRRAFGEPMKTSKRCPKHNEGKGEILPTSEFYFDKNSSDGFSGYCKACLREKRHRHYAETGPTLWGRFASLRNRARIRGIPFDLSFERFLDLLAGCCAYGSGKAPRLLMEIDRKIQELGYTEENCVSACQQHNYIKGKIFTHKSMLRIVKLFPEARECGDRRTKSRKFEPSQARPPIRTTPDPRRGDLKHLQQDINAPK